jgi:hypothetical protein
MACLTHKDNTIRSRCRAAANVVGVILCRSLVRSADEVLAVQASSLPARVKLLAGSGFGRVCVGLLCHPTPIVFRGGAVQLFPAQGDSAGAVVSHQFCTLAGMRIGVPMELARPKIHARTGRLPAPIAREKPQNAWPRAAALTRRHRRRAFARWQANVCGTLPRTAASALRSTASRASLLCERGRGRGPRAQTKRIVASMCRLRCGMVHATAPFPWRQRAGLRRGCRSIRRTSSPTERTHSRCATPSQATSAPPGSVLRPTRRGS